MANANNSTSLYTYTSNSVISKNDFTTLYNSTPGNVVQANVPDRNFTTLYTKQADITPTRSYGNANVEAFLNVGSDAGGNTVENINMSGTLTVGGESNLGDVGNVHIDGGSANYVLITDGSGNLSWAEGAGNSTPGGSNGWMQYNANGTLGGTNKFGLNPIGDLVILPKGALPGPGEPSLPLLIGVPALSVANANSAGYVTIGKTSTDIFSPSILANSNAWLSANGFIGNGFSLTNLTGANISGYVPNATHANISDSANSVAVANVSGIGNIATINLTGSSSNVLYGNGVFAPATGTATNANYANYAGNAFSVDGANVVGAVGYSNNTNHANVADLANSISGPNVVGSVNSAFHSNVADFANSVAGANVSGIVATANYAAYAGNVTIAAQSNITSLGTLTGLNVIGQTDLGVVSNVHISGGTSGYVMSTDGAGNLSWIEGTAAIPGGSNTDVQYNDDGFLGGTSTFTFNSVTNLLTVGNISSNGAQLTDLTGANVTGYVPDATHANVADLANSVAGANVTGTVANATYATTSGSSNTAITVTASSQPNITSLGTLVDLTVTGNVLSYANISGGYIFGDGSYLTGIGNLSAANGYWGSFYSNTTQTIASTTTAYPITLNNSDPDSHGVYISSNSHINFQFAGTYNIQFSAQLLNTDTITQEAHIWIRKNGVDVQDSRGTIAVADKQSGINGQTISSWNYILKLASTDYVELVWSAESTTVSLENLPAGTTPTTPAAPSMIVTAQQVTNVQPVELQGDMTGNIIGNGFSLINIASISSVDGITGASFTGDGANLSNVTGGNVTGYVANATHSNIADIANVAYSVSGANVSGDVSGANHANVADSANSVAGANVTGQVSFAAVANSVAGANVSGAVNLATYATTANSVAGSNVSGAVNLANFATTANAVAVANVVGIGNIATLNLDGNASNLLYGNGAFAPISITSVANANYANFAGQVVDAAQPNITSLGNLVDLTVSGNVAAEEVLFVGAGANSATFINPTVIAKNTGSTYIQAAIINDSANGSSDWVAYGDNSTDVNAWADMGFTSSSFSDPLYTITGPNDGYFFVQGDGSSTNGANLVIATGAQGSSKDIIFATGGFLAANEKMRFIHSINQFYIEPTTAATDSVTGALRVAGGVGIGGAAYIGGNLNVTGLSQLGNVGNVKITGGTTGQVLSTDGAGNLTWLSVTAGDANYANFAGEAFSVSGSNVSGAVSYATIANSVAVANVSGIGNIATVNLTGSTSNVLYGNGTFAAVTSVANATAANTVLSNTSSATLAYPTFFTTIANGYYTQVKTSGINANLANASITASRFIGNLTGTASDADNATTANTASNIAITSDTSNTSTQYITFVGVSAGSSSTALKNDTGLQYVPANNAITGSAGMQFDGDLVGSSSSNVTNTSKVTVGSATGNITLTVAGTVRANAHTTGLDVTGTMNVSSTVTAPTFVSNISTGTAPLTVTSTTQVANLNVARAGTADSVAVANVSGIGNIATINLDGSSSNVLYGNGAWAAAGGGGGSPAGSNTEVQFNNAGSFGANSTFTFDSDSGTLAAPMFVGDGSGLTSIHADTSDTATTVTDGAQPNITSTGTLTGLTVSGVTDLGSVGNINITGGSSGYVLSTNGSGNLSWVAQSGGSSAVDFTPSFLLGGM